MRGRESIEAQVKGDVDELRRGALPVAAHSDTPPTNPHQLAFRFGLQDTKGELTAAAKRADGRLSFDFSLTAKAGKDSTHPVFTGRFASGPATDRFVYLSWFAIERGDWINRVKARLATIDWEMVRAAQQQGKAITADMTGRGPGDIRKPLTWYLE